MKVFNRKFNREYKEIEKYEAGIVLTGAEVKTAKTGNIRLDDAFVRVINSEVFLINADIPVYKFARPQGYDSRRTRKLLLNKKEILKIEVKLKTGNLTVVPVSCYDRKNKLKVEIALAQGRKTWEVKKVEKNQDVQREDEKELREYKNDKYSDYDR